MKKINLNFKSLFLLYACGLAPIFLFCGIMSLFGVATVQWDGRNQVGIQGLIFSIFFIPIFAGAITILSWVVLRLGHFIFRTCFKKAMHHIEPQEEEIFFDADTTKS
ncbi:hypothetical protein ACE38W_13255 [Chitinophaga sp. Hz27]|uniref:hypothetical protein n=1 Tax=Chitinophaga sp. Hz27 TaxID=3347169 RepID=UPI0035D58A8A